MSTPETRVEPRVRFGPIVLEAFLVVLGVSLALGGDEWRARRSARAHADRARADVVEELRANAAAVERSQAYHASRIDTLRTLLGAGGGPITPSVFPQGFVRPATLMTTAWDAARATDGLAEMPYEDVLAFSRAYAQQGRYEMTSREMGGVLYRDLMDYGAQGVAARGGNLLALISALYYTEQQLQATYSEVIAEVSGDAD